MRTYLNNILLAAVVILLSSPLWVGKAEAAGEYLLGSSDKIFMRIVEWRPSVDNILEWKALSRAYVVRANGTISVPLIGSIRAKGMSADELAQKISVELKRKMNLAITPDTTIEIVTYRPFYLLGIVEQQGEYAFRPGLTVLQALSIAGGVRRRPKNTTISRQDMEERQLIRANGKVKALGRAIKFLEIRKYKLQSELDGKRKIQYPGKFVRKLRRAGYKKFLQRTSVAFQKRLAAWQLKVASVKKQKRLITKEKVALRGQLLLKKKEAKLSAFELRKTKSLVNKNLISLKDFFQVQQRYTAVRASISGLNVRQISIEKRILDLSLGLQAAKSSFHKTIAEELEKVEIEIRRKAEGLKTAQELYRHLKLNRSDDSQIETSVKTKTSIQFKIVRRKDGASTEFDVIGDFQVKPGDVVKVLRRFDEGVLNIGRPSSSVQ